MPRFAEIFPEMAQVLAKVSARADFERDDADPWTDFVRAVLNGVEARKRERAIQALRDADLLSPRDLAETELIELVETLREANATLADRDVIALKRSANWLTAQHDGDLESLSTIDSDTLREQLSAIKGISLSLADSILLFGLGRGVARFDRAGFRILVRHGWLDPSSEPEEFRSLLENALDFDPVLLADWALKLDALARDYCRVSVAKCEKCPLRPFLPRSGPLGGIDE